MNHLTYAEAQKLAQSGKKIIFIDVRTPGEHHLEHIRDSINLPLDTFDATSYREQLEKYDTVIAYCNTGNVSSQFIKRAAQSGMNNVSNLTGGISVCKDCPIEKEKGPLPIMRQVQVAAGGLVLLGIILSWMAYPFIGISLFVGAGLVFAGISGWCGMAKILGKMPWNNPKLYQKSTEVTGENLLIRQFEDKKLAHYSYIALSDGKAIVIDPERDIQKYIDFAKDKNATIVGILNTHPHADFASGHLELHEKTRATIYVGEKVGAEYPHVGIKNDDEIVFGSSKIISYFTPGHSPDSISYMALDTRGKEVGFFTGDWLFIGDVGRADLRENVGNIKAQQRELAGNMYDTTRAILPQIDGDTMILPAHGAGTSCGKGLSKQNMATLENQRKFNPMLQDMPREDFIAELTSDQPAIPAYFTNSVLLNKKGNTSYTESKEQIKSLTTLPKDIRIIDTRSWEKVALNPVHPDALNIDQESAAFTGLLGAIIMPDEKYAIIIEKNANRESIIHDILSIGYETNLVGIYSLEHVHIDSMKTTRADIKENPSIRILDVRSVGTVTDNPYDLPSINIPIEELPHRFTELDKKVTYVPYCGGAYKSSLALTWLQTHGYKAQKLIIS